MSAAGLDGSRVGGFFDRDRVVALQLQRVPLADRLEAGRAIRVCADLVQQQRLAKQARREFLAALLEARQAGIPIRQLAEVCGVSESRIVQLIKAATEAESRRGAVFTSLISDSPVSRTSSGDLVKT